MERSDMLRTAVALGIPAVTYWLAPPIWAGAFAVLSAGYLIAFVRSKPKMYGEAKV
jgi:hypothetical protein